MSQRDAGADEGGELELSPARADAGGTPRVEHPPQSTDRRFSALFGTDLVGLAVLDTDGTVTEANGRLRQMTGLAPDHPPLPFANLLLPAYRDAFAELGKQMWGTDPTATISARLAGPAGAGVSVVLSRCAVAEPGGESLVVVVDASMSDETQIEQSRRARELEQANADLQQFVYTIAHDLREPLRSVSSYARLLFERHGDTLDHDAREFLDFIREGAQRMREQIDGLLEYSRVYTQARPFTAVALTLPLEDSVIAMSGELEAAGGSITTDHDLPVVYADRRQISKLFQILLGNALKFRSNRPPTIHIRAQREGRRWRIEVEDNGIGIPTDARHRIFEVFGRLHTSSEYPGCGIGLAIAKRIVERHGGNIEAVPGRTDGATLVFTLSEVPESALQTRQ
ncbi:MAG: hypothetical protein KDK91_10960 [Gammaproteobacteria bacterium]|nr:hypothetical protein [Gammaproteobacteria bacterium]